MVLKKRLFLFLGMFLLVVGVGVYTYTQQIPNPGHGGDEVLVTINGFTMTLQEAIDYDFLVDGVSSPTQDNTTEISGAYHTAEEIYVSVDGDERSLQEFLSGEISLCGGVSSSYTLDISFGHSANETLVSVGGEEMTFQEAINGGEFCSGCVSHDSYACYDHDVYWYDSCGGIQEKKEECHDCMILEGYGGCVPGSDYIRVQDCLHGGCYSHDQCYSDIPDACLGRIS